MTDSPNPVKLVAVYARVSTARQEEDGTIETQLAAVRAYAKEHNFTIVEEYKDEGWSGDVLVRPEMDRLRQDASSKSRVWSGVLSYDPDRIARRYSFQELVCDELKEKGAEVLFVTISEPKNPEDRILMGVRGLFAEYERTKISERFRMGKFRKIQEGKLLVSQPLYGYHLTPKNGKESGFYTVNEAEAKVVRKMFAWVANEGLTIRQVVKRLEAEKIPPRKSLRGVWNTSTLTTLLRNEAYIGKAHWYSSVAVVPKNPISPSKYRKIKKSSRQARPRKDWMTIDVPRVISDELFERARTRLTENALLNKRSKKYEYLLAQRVVCVCGRRRVGAGRQKGKYLYYDCPDKIYCFPQPRKCYENPINARVADELIWKKLSALVCSPKLLQEQVDRWSKKRPLRGIVSTEDVKSLEKEILKLKREEDRYNRAYGAGAFSMEDWLKYISPIRERIELAQHKIVENRESKKQAESLDLPSKIDIKKITERMTDGVLNLSFEQKRDIVLATVEQIVGNQERLEVRGYIPVSTTLYGGFKTENRHRRSPERRQVDAF